MKQIYRVGISGMFGYNEESFYTSKDTAFQAFDNLVEKKRKNKNTLSDKDCESEMQQTRNFSEVEHYPNVKETNCIKRLKEVLWSYGYNQSSENGTEFYSYTDHLILEEIDIKI